MRAITDPKTQITACKEDIKAAIGACLDDPYDQSAADRLAESFLALHDAIYNSTDLNDEQKLERLEKEILRAVVSSPTIGEYQLFAKTLFAEDQVGGTLADAYLFGVYQKNEGTNKLTEAQLRVLGALYRALQYVVETRSSMYQEEFEAWSRPLRPARFWGGLAAVVVAVGSLALALSVLLPKLAVLPIIAVITANFPPAAIVAIAALIGVLSVVTAITAFRTLYRLDKSFTSSLWSMISWSPESFKKTRSGYYKASSKYRNERIGEMLISLRRGDDLVAFEHPALANPGVTAAPAAEAGESALAPSLTLGGSSSEVGAAAPPLAQGSALGASDSEEADKEEADKEGLGSTRALHK